MDAFVIRFLEKCELKGGKNNLIEWQRAFVNNKQRRSVTKAICYQCGSKKQKRQLSAR